MIIAKKEKSDSSSPKVETYEDDTEIVKKALQ
jgi:hypothetical protein